jgi:5-formyltetrahydrofolate cyclo-ligase
MINGVGGSEFLVIIVLFLLFFGAKDLPQFIRKASELMRKARSYTDSVRRELDTIARAAEPKFPVENSVVEEKKKLRTNFLAVRKGLNAESRAEKSAQIADRFLALPKVQSARSVMVYVHSGSEVQTGDLIRRLMEAGKRVVIPYCRVSSRDLGLAAITDLESQTARGEYGIREPVQEVRENFFKSDLGLVAVPGLSFDKGGGRLGRGMGYYDNFLRELRGRAPIVGLAFDCQVSEQRFPFSYSDVLVDQVVTESAVVLEDREGLGSDPTPPEAKPPSAQS